MILTIIQFALTLLRKLVSFDNPHEFKIHLKNDNKSSDLALIKFPRKYAKTVIKLGSSSHFNSDDYLIGGLGFDVPPPNLNINPTGLESILPGAIRKIEVIAEIENVNGFEQKVIDVWDTSLKTTYGNSGGPVFDRCGRAVGVIFSKGPNNNQDSGVIPIQEARIFLLANNIEILDRKFILEVKSYEPPRVNSTQNGLLISSGIWELTFNPKRKSCNFRSLETIEQMRHPIEIDPKQTQATQRILFTEPINLKNGKQCYFTEGEPTKLTFKSFPGLGEQKKKVKVGNREITLMKVYNAHHKLKRNINQNLFIGSSIATDHRTPLPTENIKNSEMKIKKCI